MDKNMEWWMFPVLLIVGFVCGIINVMAGGGSLISMPVLITFFNLPPIIANGTNRVGILVQNIAGVAGFFKKGVKDVRMSVILSIPAVSGALVGVFIAVKIDEVLFKRVLAFVMLLVLVMIVLKPEQKLKKAGTLTPQRQIWTYIAFFFIGMYGGFLQIGVGLMVLAVTSLISQMDLVQSNCHKVFVVGIFTFFAVVAFAIQGTIRWPIALVLSVGNGLGGWYGSILATHGGEKWIRVFLVISVIPMSMKLLGIF